MSEKRMLIVDAELVKRIDDNRGDLGRSDFINFLIESELKEKETGKKQGGVTRDEFHQIQEGTKELLRSFLEFFISYGRGLGRQPGDNEFEKLAQKLQGLGSSAKANRS